MPRNHRCPARGDSGAETDDGVTTDGAMVSQSTGGLKKNYLYLDTCSTEDQMVNPSYLKKIHQAENPLGYILMLDHHRLSRRGT